MTPTLLVADDSVTVQRVIELTFADEGVRVVTAGDGAQAIAALDAEPPAVVLADAGLPGRNGYEIAEHVRASPALAATRVVLLTGVSEPCDEARAAAVRLDGVLAKPFEPQEIIALVRRLLAGDVGTDAEEGAASSPSPALAGASGGEAAAGAPAPRERVDDYFDRLDRALVERTGASTAASTPRATPDAAPFRPAHGTPPLRPPEETAPLPAQDSAPSPRLVALPRLADAFAALLAAEEPGGGGEGGWPSPSAVPSEALVEEIARVVLDRLPDTVVRSAVSDVVTVVAERLVREEIERLKAAVDGADKGSGDG